MRKTDKKIDNQLRDILTDVCEDTLKEINGFLWVTHMVNFSNFPQSLKIVCVFDTNEQLSRFVDIGENSRVNAVIQKALEKGGINLKNPANQITYDTQENCDRDNRGKWENRLR